MEKRNAILEIDLNVISNNVEVLQSYVKDGVKHLAVVKADAYGHGSVEVAKKIAPQVDWFAVNDVDEGIELRTSGIQRPILVFMPPEADTAQAYKEHNLTATVSAAEHFELLAGGTDYHLMFDTGMGRMGLNKADVERVLELKDKVPRLNCTGIYSHFATADEVNSPKLKEQLDIFKAIRPHFKDNLLTHFCNTGALVQLEDAHFDMVRSGIGIYGYGPGAVEVAGLASAMRWRTYLAQVKPIAKGDTVSYGATWQCPEDGYLGVIPVGFEDGLPRRLSGKLQVKIGDTYCATVGIVTMNYTMVYLKNNQFKKGKEVLLLGEKNTARSWADSVGTIAYEVLTRISPKIPREYVG